MKKTIKKIVITLLIYAVISIVSFLLLRAFNVITYEDKLKLNLEMFNKFTNSWYGFTIIVLAQVIIKTLLTFIPGISMAFIVLIQTIYSNPISAFIVAFSSVLISSIIMYIIGRYGGYKLVKLIIGEEDTKKASDLLNHKGKIYFPLMMLFPIFPDDALVMIAGTLKMSLKWFIPSVILGRGIGVLTIIFGLSFIPFHLFTSFWHWFIFILICAVGILLVFYLATKLNNYLEKHKHIK